MRTAIGTKLLRAISATRLRELRSLLVQQDFRKPATYAIPGGFALGAGSLVAARLLGNGVVPEFATAAVVLGGAAWLGLRAQPKIIEAFREPMKMIELPGGTFVMGTPESDELGYGDEHPPHSVTLSPFAMSEIPVTRELYRTVAKAHHSVKVPKEWGESRDDDRMPANHVTFRQAIEFCNAASRMCEPPLEACYRIDGDRIEWNRKADGYRLPTEAEWEYAARGGTTTRWICGDSPERLGEYAWFAENSGKQVHPIVTTREGSIDLKKPNTFGLHFMIGNCLAWCWDWYAAYSANHAKDPSGPEDGENRVIRGGSAWNDARLLRSALRLRYGPEVSHLYLGFRCVRSPRRQR